MVEGQLFEAAAAKTIGAAVAHVGHQDPGGQQQERAGGGAHAAKLRRGLTAGVDLVVGVQKGRNDRLRRRLVQQLAIAERDHVGGDLAGQLARRVGAHAVGHQEEVAALLKIGLIARQGDGIGILVICPPQANVAQRGQFEAVTPDSGGLIHIVSIAAT